MARVRRAVQGPGVHRRAPIILRRILICTNERIYDGIGVVSSGSHIVTGAMETAGVLSQYRRH
eukprot:9486376-Pyramimonas_sp.AAC.1